MPVPNFQCFLVPILQIAADGRLHSPREFEDGAADALELTEDDRTRMLPSGSMTILRDRTGWAYYHLFRAGLLERPKRATYKITERGVGVLKEHPRGIDQKVLRQFPEYLSYLAPKSKDADTTITLLSEAASNQKTPHEQIEDAFSLLQKKLVQELLEQIHAQSPAFFEQMVIDLLVKMNYGGSKRDAAVVGRSGDGGIDGVIKEDRLGLDAIYVQAKRWKDKVGTPQIRDFVGSLVGKGAHKGVFITTSSFQPAVHEYLRGVQHKVVLLDGEQLAALCIEFNIGVAVQDTYAIKRIDLDFFDEA
jgi:restriction system protein